MTGYIGIVVGQHFQISLGHLMAKTGMFLANKFRRLPVVEDGKTVGAIRRYDLLRVVRKLSAMP